MKIVINHINNMLEVHRGKSNKCYYLARNILCRTEKLKLRDCLRLKKKIISVIEQFSDDKNMLFHYKIVVGPSIHLIIYCIKQQLEDTAISSNCDIMPVQFFINKKYGINTAKDNVLCIVYRIESVIYLIYTRRKSIIYSRMIDNKAVDSIEHLIHSDMDMINKDLQENFKFNVISNIESLKKEPFISKYLKEDKKALSI